MKTVDVIIPVYKPDERLKKIISRLRRQSYPVNRIILINTGRAYFEQAFSQDMSFFEAGDIVLRHISEEQFDHGRTRRMAVSISKADYFVCMTDDALPLDRHLIKELTSPLMEGKASAAYARQLAGKEADIVEKFSRRFNYPAVSRIKNSKDFDELGIKTFFCSNACAAYERKTYDALGGFEKHMIFNEDMVYAGRLIDSGASIAYVAEARVLHTHHYTAMQQLKRNFDLGVSQAQFPELFNRVSSQSEGIRMIRGMLGVLLKKNEYDKMPSVIINSAFKLAGYKLGKAYKKLPQWLIMKLTMNRNYWKSSF
ncbi:MAG: glycosyltransferase [Lachnospiraceae bacterium]|nr:glycosyltransferase [Lachnospiraceae bacterium]